MAKVVPYLYHRNHMCGIAGYIRAAGLFEPSVLEEMIRRVRHRGPEDAGSWIDPKQGVALGHARLKIQDLTDA
ncbi:MAG TPA: hypothetical protein VNT79_15125, partial [Phycisphaerae bacterium]|nr:hypothetical protein [Phycisphaerae bacterium]